MEKFESEKIIKELADKYNISLEEAIEISEACMDIFKEVMEEIKTKVHNGEIK